MKTFQWILLFLVFASLIPANSNAGVYRSVIRKTAKISDDVPLRALDETARPETRKMARELVENGRKFDQVSYSRQLAKQVENALTVTADPVLLRTISTIDDAGKETVLLLCRGSKNVSQAIPDIARRADFLKTVDADTLCVLGRYDGLAGEARNMDFYLKKNLITTPKGLRRANMSDFGNFFRKNGTKGVEWWKKNVQPHWKAWAVGGALTAILIMPESYTDYVIEKAADGSVKIVHAGGKTLGEMLKASERSMLELLKGIFSSTLGIVLSIVASLLFLLWFLSLSIVQKVTAFFIRTIRRSFHYLIPRTKKNIGHDLG